MIQIRSLSSITPASFVACAIPPLQAGVLALSLRLAAAAKHLVSTHQALQGLSQQSLPPDSSHLSAPGRQ